jgi:hypothetical protein
MPLINLAKVFYGEYRCIDGLRAKALLDFRPWSNTCLSATLESTPPKYYIVNEGPGNQSCTYFSSIYS